jgi:hypothetical protein
MSELLLRSSTFSTPFVNGLSLSTCMEQADALMFPAANILLHTQLLVYVEKKDI